MFFGARACTDPVGREKNTHKKCCTQVIGPAGSRATVSAECAYVSITNDVATSCWTHFQNKMYIICVKQARSNVVASCDLIMISSISVTLCSVILTMCSYIRMQIEQALSFVETSHPDKTLASGRRAWVASYIRG